MTFLEDMYRNDPFARALQEDMDTIRRIYAGIQTLSNLIIEQRRAKVRLRMQNA